MEQPSAILNESAVQQHKMAKVRKISNLPKDSRFGTGKLLFRLVHTLQEDSSPKNSYISEA